MKKSVKRILLVIMLTSFALGSFSAAQESATKSTGRVVVHAGKLLDVRSGKTLTDQAIVIEAGKITSVGPFAQAKPSADDRVVDLSNATVLPGLTDAHTHLTGNPQDVGPQALSISIPRATLTGARNARITLEAGFTTVRNVGADGYSDVALRDAINAGDVPGPAHAGERASPRHHRRPLRRERAPFEFHVLCPRSRRRSGRRAAQSP